MHDAFRRLNLASKVPTFNGMSERQFIRYVRSLPKTNPQLDAALRREIVRHPDVIIAVVKMLREMAVDPSVSPAVRRDAATFVKKHGYDDESLKGED